MTSSVTEKTYFEDLPGSYASEPGALTLTTGARLNPIDEPKLGAGPSGGSMVGGGDERSAPAPYATSPAPLSTPPDGDTAEAPEASHHNPEPEAPTTTTAGEDHAQDPGQGRRELGTEDGGG